MSVRPRVRLIASAVTTPHPPAVETTQTLGPFGNGWLANVAAASYASSIVAARTTPAWRQAPSKTRSSVARLPVWLAAARAPTPDPPPCAGLAVTGGRDERGAKALGRALVEQVDVRLRRRADEHEVRLAIGKIVDVGHRVDAEHGSAFEVRGEDVALVAGSQQVVQRHEA